MATFATLPIAADRAGACVRRIVVRGLDLTDTAPAAEIRLSGDTPGAALVVLPATTSANVLGVRVVDVATLNGIPESTIELFVSQAVMRDPAKIPYSGEVGEASVLAYGLVATIGGVLRTIATGPFVALPTVYGADNAPTGRELAYGAGSGHATWDTAAITFSDDGTTIEIDGISQLQPFIDNAALFAGVAEAAATAAAAASEQAILDAAAAVVTANAAVTFVSSLAKAIPAKGNLPEGASPNLIVGTATAFEDDYFELIGCPRAVALTAGETAVFQISFGADEARTGHTVAVSIAASKTPAASWPTGNRVQAVLFDEDNATQTVTFADAFETIDGARRRYHKTFTVTLAKPAVRVQLYSGVDVATSGLIRYTGFAATASSKPIVDLDFQDWDPFAQGAHADQLSAIAANGVLPGLVTPVAMVGDSTVRGVDPQVPIPTSLATQLGTPVANLGVIGQTTPQIMARIGVVPITVSVAGNSIPANAPVALTALNIAPINHTGPDFNDGSGNCQLALRGWLRGVYGYLQRPVAGSAPEVPASSFTFTRFEAGTAVACPAGSVFTPYNEGFDLAGTIIVSMGYNNLTVFKRVTEDFRRMRAAMPTVFPRLVFLDVPAAYSDDDTRIAAIQRINQWLVEGAGTYGWCVIPIGRYVSSLEALEDAGIAPTSGDLAAIARGAMPPSLSADAGPHGTSKHNELVATQLTEILRARHWA